MPTQNKPADEEPLEERAVGEIVDLARIDTEIREQREALAAQRNQLDELERGRLSWQTIEVLLTDLLDIWTNTGQLVGLERQQRDELRIIANELRDMNDELRGLRGLLEQRNDRRAHWHALLRERRRELSPAPPLADLRFRRDEPEAPRKPSGEGVGGAGEGGEIPPSGGEG